MPIKYIFFIALFFSHLVCAQTVNDLQKSGRLKIKVWIEPAENIIARQQISLNIEIATDTRFDGGTQIEHFEVADAIVLQREKFALNSTRKAEGKNWIIQQWTLVVYPQRDGVFKVPAIPLRIAIATEKAKSIKGEVFAAPFKFNAMLPEPMSLNDSWVATRRFKVDESFDKSFDQLAVGDALIRSIKISADNLPAMMLPEVMTKNIPGIATYPDPPRLIDKVNRGEYLAERIQSITYMFEKPGQYVLPEEKFYWWNLATHSYDVIKLASHAFTIIATADVALSKHKQKIISDNLWPLLAKISGGILLLLFVLFAVKKLKTHYRKKCSINSLPLTESILFKRFEKACLENDYEHAMGVIYQWLDYYGGSAFKGTVRESLKGFNKIQLMAVFNNIMRAIYAKENNSEIDLKLFFNHLSKQLKKEKQLKKLSLYVDLKLN